MEIDDLNTKLAPWVEYARKKKAVFWIGSGISAIAGCKTFKGIIESLCEELEELSTVREVMGSFKDNLEAISFIIKRLKECDAISKFDTIIHRCLKYDRNKFNNNYKPIIQSLWNITPAIPIITTNIDNNLRMADYCSDNNRYYNVNSFTFPLIGHAVYHLHGIAEKNDTWKWDIETIRESYSGALKRFVEEIARKYAILFLGTSLKDKYMEFFYSSNYNPPPRFALFSLEEINGKEDFINRLSWIYGIDVVIYGSSINDLKEKIISWSEAITENDIFVGSDEGVLDV